MIEFILWCTISRTIIFYSSRGVEEVRVNIWERGLIVKYEAALRQICQDSNFYILPYILEIQLFSK